MKIGTDAFRPNQKYKSGTPVALIHVCMRMRVNVSKNTQE